MKSKSFQKTVFLQTCFVAYDFILNWHNYTYLWSIVYSMWWTSLSNWHVHLLKHLAFHCDKKGSKLSLLPIWKHRIQFCESWTPSWTRWHRELLLLFVNLFVLPSLSAFTSLSFLVLGTTILLTLLHVSFFTFHKWMRSWGTCLSAPVWFHYITFPRFIGIAQGRFFFFFSFLINGWKHHTV